MKKSQAKIPVPTETQEQKAVIKFWAEYARLLGLDERLLVHTPNERRCTPMQGAQLKAMGVRAGWPDLFLAVPRGRYHGLFIEMKSLSGTPSKTQKELHPIIEAQGYLVAVCYGCKEATDILVRYLAQTQAGEAV